MWYRTREGTIVWREGSQAEQRRADTCLVLCLPATVFLGGAEASYPGGIA